MGLISEGWKQQKKRQEVRKPNLVLRRNDKNGEEKDVLLFQSFIRRKMGRIEKISLLGAKNKHVRALSLTTTAVRVRVCVCVFVATGGFTVADKWL